MLKGKNIRLRPFEEMDSLALNLMRSDTEGMKLLIGNPFPGNEASQKEWISHMYGKGVPQNIYLLIEENVTGHAAGYIAARNIDYVNSHADVGVYISPDFRNKAYFREAQILFYDYLFNQLNLHKLYSIALPENTVSINSIKKLGFVEEGLMKEYIYQDGVYKDVQIVSLFRDTFNKLIKYTIFPEKSANTAL